MNAISQFTRNEKDRLRACPNCDLLYRFTQGAIERLDCRRCGKTLRDKAPRSLSRTFCFSSAGFLLLLLANIHPFLTTLLGSQSQRVLLHGCVARLFADNYSLVGFLVGGVLILLPLVSLGITTLVSGSLLHGWELPYRGTLFRYYIRIREWAMPEIFLLGVFVAYTEIVHYARIEMDVGFYCFVGALVLAVLVARSIDVPLIWSMCKPDSVVASDDTLLLSAAQAGLAGCATCGWLEGSEAIRCPRCNGRIEDRKPNSVTHTLCFLLAALICYIPANLFPVMVFHKLGTDSGATIVEGAHGLFRSGSWPLGLLVLFASFLVPIVKIISLFLLLRATRHTSQDQHICRLHTRLYRCVMIIGRWSMLDVFVMSITVSLLYFSPQLTVTPGIGVSFFSAVVVLTMLAAGSFDPRLLWIESNNKRSA